MSDKSAMNLEESVQHCILLSKVLPNPLAAGIFVQKCIAK